MDTTSNDAISITGCDSFIARLRRLKIQESIFINNVKNSLLKCPDYKENNNLSNDLKLKMFSDNLKKSFIEIKNLFEDVKIKTHFQVTMEKYDIDELKRDIIEMETKIKSFKQYTQNELRTLQYEETVIKEKAIKNQAKLKIPALPTKQYNEVVTSPVRVIINSPFKCLKTIKSDGGIDNTILSRRQNILAKEKLEKALIDDQIRRNSQTELRDNVMNGTKQRFMKPTKQWINKRNSIKEVSFGNYDVDSITKLHSPSWRVNIRNSYIMSK